mgnify:CR=1 FL=1
MYVGDGWAYLDAAADFARGSGDVGRDVGGERGGGHYGTATFGDGGRGWRHGGGNGCSGGWRCGGSWLARGTVGSFADAFSGGPHGGGCGGFAGCRGASGGGGGAGCDEPVPATAARLEPGDRPLWGDEPGPRADPRGDRPCARGAEPFACLCGVYGDGGFDGLFDGLWLSCGGGLRRWVDDAVRPFECGAGGAGSGGGQRGGARHYGEFGFFDGGASALRDSLAGYAGESGGVPRFQDPAGHAAFGWSALVSRRWRWLGFGAAHGYVYADEYADTDEYANGDADADNHADADLDADADADPAATDAHSYAVAACLLRGRPVALGFGRLWG